MATSFADDQVIALRCRRAALLASSLFLAASLLTAPVRADEPATSSTASEPASSPRPLAAAPTVPASDRAAAAPTTTATAPVPAPTLAAPSITAVKAPAAPVLMRDPVPGTAPTAAATVEKSTSCLPKTFSLKTGGTMARTADHLARRMGLKVLAIGSSSTEGIGATSPAKAYPAQLALDLVDRLRGMKIDVRNAGIGGETIDKTIVRLDQELDRYKPDLVLWQVGTNDAITAGNSEDRFRSYVEAGVRATVRHDADIVLIDPQYFPKIKDVPRYERYVDIVRAVAEANGVGLFPRYRLMRAIDGEPGGILPLMGPDAFHMGDRGYACIADLLADQIVFSVARTARAH